EEQDAGTAKGSAERIEHDPVDTALHGPQQHRLGRDHFRRCIRDRRKTDLGLELASEIDHADPIELSQRRYWYTLDSVAPIRTRVSEPSRAIDEGRCSFDRNQAEEAILEQDLAFDYPSGALGKHQLDRRFLSSTEDQLGDGSRSRNAPFGGLNHHLARRNVVDQEL